MSSSRSMTAAALTRCTGIWSPRGSNPSSMTTSMSKLICVTSRTLCPSPFLPRLEAIARAGAGAILLREKDLTPEEYASLACPVLALCRQAGIPCILHNHPEATLTLGADALHLPMPALRGLDEAVRARFAQLGASCHSLEEAREAQALGCTYITLGHIFPTGCQAGRPAPGRGAAPAGLPGSPSPGVCHRRDLSGAVPRRASGRGPRGPV